MPGNDPNNLTPVLRFRFSNVGSLEELVPIPAFPESDVQDPSYTAISPQGELFVANRHGNVGNGKGTIARFRLDASGNLTATGTISGNGLEEAVHGLAFRSNGELFAANLFNGTIARFVFDSQGQAIANGTFATGEIFNQGIAFAPSGELFTTHSNAIIHRWLIDPNTNEVIPNGTFFVPGASRLHGIIFSPSSEMFVADPDTNLVHRFLLGSSGELIPNRSIPVVGGPLGVAWNPIGELFVTGHFAGGISRFVFDTNGNAIQNGSTISTDSLGGPSILAAPLTTPLCGRLTQEAESGMLVGKFVVANDATASGGQYVSVPLGRGDAYGGFISPYRVDYCFNVATEGAYRIRAKAFGSDDLSDSFYVQVDGVPSTGYLWDLASSNSYTLQYVKDRGKTDQIEVTLGAGAHNVSIYLREDGARLDTIELQRIADSVSSPICSGLYQEAESGALIGNFVSSSDSTASNGQYIYIPNSSGDFWNGPNPQHKATYCVNVDTAGTYRINGKVYGADTLSDSFYVQVDNAPTNGYLWDVLPNTTYASDFVNDRNVADPVEVLLSSGQHTVTVYAREDGTRLDTIELQRVSTGVDPTPTCAGLTQEAENGALIGNFVAMADTAASGGKFVHTPNGSGDFWSGPNARQKASYCFNVPNAGTYRIDGKVLGADTLSDSFYVQVDGTPAAGYLWDVTPSSTYVNDSVSDRNKADPVILTLAAGPHTVSVYAREDGTRIDTISLVPTTPSTQSRAIPPIAQGVHGTVRINATDLTQEIDFSQITVTVVDAETNGQSFRQQVPADRFGQFYFDGMMPGEYKVQLTLPHGLVTATSEVTVTASADEVVEASFDVSVQAGTGAKTYLPLINR